MAYSHHKPLLTFETLSSGFVSAIHRVLLPEQTATGLRDLFHVDTFLRMLPQYVEEIKPPEFFFQMMKPALL
jgi:hypothetical protein